MLSLLPRLVVAEPPHYQALGPQLHGHAPPEEALDDPRSVLHYEGQDALLVEVAREQGVETVVHREFAYVEEHLGEDLEAAGGVGASVDAIGAELAAVARRGRRDALLREVVLR